MFSNMAYASLSRRQANGGLKSGPCHDARALCIWGSANFGSAIEQIVFYVPPTLHKFPMMGSH